MIGPGSHGDIEITELTRPRELLRQRRMLATVFAFVLVVDGLTKFAASQLISGSPVTIIGAAQLRILRNSRAPFGLGSSDIGTAILIASATAVLGMVIWAWRGGTRLSVPIGLAAGGATANLLDRLLGGGVTDWIAPGTGSVFNLADVFIITGLALFFTSYILGPKKSE